MLQNIAKILRMSLNEFQLTSQYAYFLRIASMTASVPAEVHIFLMFKLTESSRERHCLSVRSMLERRLIIMMSIRAGCRVVPVFR